VVREFPNNPSEYQDLVGLISFQPKGETINHMQHAHREMVYPRRGTAAIRQQGNTSAAARYRSNIKS